MKEKARESERHCRGMRSCISLIALRVDGSKVSRVSLLTAYVRATFLEGFRNVGTLMSPEVMRETHPTTPHNAQPL